MKTCMGKNLKYHHAQPLDLSVITTNKNTNRQSDTTNNDDITCSREVIHLQPLKACEASYREVTTLKSRGYTATWWLWKKTRASEQDTAPACWRWMVYIAGCLEVIGGVKTTIKIPAFRAICNRDMLSFSRSVFLHGSLGDTQAAWVVTDIPQVLGQTITW